MKSTIGKANKGINVEKIIIGLKNKNFKKKRERKKENSTELQNPKVEAEFIKTAKNVTEKQKAQKLS